MSRRLLLTGAITFALFLHTSSGNAQTPYEIKFEVGSGGAWFGGDNRTVGGPRHVGQGQGVLVTTDIVLEQFSFSIAGPFDYQVNPVGGVTATVTLDVRDESGTVLETAQVVVPSNFLGGWITWTGLSTVVAANSTLVFTAYVNGAYDTNQVKSSMRADPTTAAYTDGVRYVAGGTSDAMMGMWSSWGVDSSWDMHFWLQGTTTVPIQENSWGKIKSLYSNW